VTEREMQETAGGGPVYECPDCGNLTIRGKWSMDGARTLTEAAEKLRDFAHQLEHMRASGLQLIGPIEDDYGVVGPGGAPGDDGADEGSDE
jgi:hypothetical protein